MSGLDYFCLAAIAVLYAWALWANREIHRVRGSMAHRKGGRMGRGP